MEVLIAPSAASTVIEGPSTAAKSSAREGNGEAKVDLSTASSSAVNEVNKGHQRQQEMEVRVTNFHGGEYMGTSAFCDNKACVECGDNKFHVANT